MVILAVLIKVILPEKGSKNPLFYTFLVMVFDRGFGEYTGVFPEDSCLSFMNKG
jgi:hypothetical protein